MGNLLMTEKEAKRIHLLEEYQKKSITLMELADFIGVSYRQAKRLWSCYKLKGQEGVLSKKRNIPSNRKIQANKRALIMQLLKERYDGFGPTLASEKLQECHEIKISKETLRQWMIKEGLWSNKLRRKNCHQRRERKKYEGEMALADASKHLWFGPDYPKAALHVVVDDATSKIMGLWFEEEECLSGYFELFKRYFITHGIPLNLYVDRHTIFKSPGKGGKESDTQLGKAFKELKINIIYAHSPQAKGRVERANGTLQDRLVKELKLQGITTAEEANKYLPIFIEQYNSKFAKPAASSFNAHIPVKQETDLNKILCRKEERKVNKNLELSYKGITYQLDKTLISLMGNKVSICEGLTGELSISFKGKELSYRRYDELEYTKRIPTTEELLRNWHKSKGHKPKKDHPFKKVIARAVA